MDEIEVGNVYELTDNDSGETSEYEVVGLAALSGVQYAALVPYGEQVEEYVILRLENEKDQLLFCTIEDDDEWERAATYFDDEIFGIVDHDEE